MTTYTTQMDAARKGIVTPQIKTVAEKEHMPVEKLMELVAEGKVAICANKHHTCLNPEGVGSMLRTKINVNLGVSRDCKDYDIEMQKVMKAVDLGAEAIMDLSSHGNTQPFRQKLTHECPAMIGTVPVYDSVIHYQRDLSELTAHDFIDVIRLHAEDGVDFVTLHCGITRKTIEQIKKHKRKMNIVSRGGSLVFAWMSMTGEENPFYEYFDEILDICEEHDVTISLGDACRPGCLADATDVCQIEELVRLGELTKRAWDHNVQVMVEGPGHVPLDQVAANMKVQQTICMGAPFYVLGPLVTDIAPGYDHITAAIGGAVAAMNGAAFLCYVTPAEHLALPNVEDVKQGIIASKIAAHAADIAKGIPHARDIDDKMADARRVLDWDAQFACALDPETAKAIRDDRLPEDDHSDTCSMCGKFCAVRSMNKALAGALQIADNGSNMEKVESTITQEASWVDTSLEVDQQLEEEQKNGYTWEEPLVVQNPYRYSPLTAVILFDTDEECEVRVTVKGKTEAADIEGTIDVSTSHRVPVVGLYAGQENTVLLELLDDTGKVSDSQEIKITTDELPEKMNDAVTPVKTSGESALPLTIVHGQGARYPYAYDCMGDVRKITAYTSADHALHISFKKKTVRCSDP